jgi:phage/plasmid primase-like uncharacterized protein
MSEDMSAMPVERDDARALTFERAVEIVHEFRAAYPAAYAIEFKVRQYPENIYGTKANTQRGHTINGSYEPASRAQRERDPLYRGRCDIAYATIGDEGTLRRTLAHEVIGHFGLNTFSPREKYAVLRAVVAAKGQLGISDLWESAQYDYEGLTDLQLAEEVYAYAAELITEPARRPQVAQTLRDTCLEPTRTLRLADLQHITEFVACGLKDLTRDQETFPRTPRTQFAQTPAHAEQVRAFTPLSQRDASQTVGASPISPPNPVPNKPFQETSMASTGSRSNSRSGAKPPARLQLSLEDVQKALTFIPADIDHKRWVRMAMAIKSEFPGEGGEQAFQDWSAGAKDYNPNTTISTWKSISEGGAVTMGTLVAEAKTHGWNPPRADSKKSDTSARKAVDTEQLAAQRVQAAALEQAEKLAKMEAVIPKAAELWARGTPGAVAPYLQRKGVEAHGTRSMDNGELLVPLVDTDGRLWNVQRILPRAMQSGNDKLFIKSGRKSGLFHVIGEIDPVKPILLAEGYATAASVHEATGRPVVVSFDAGNLAKVARAFREKYPDTALVIAGDDDVPTFLRKNVNPGRDAAQEVARDVEGLVAFPSGDGFTGKDFNDLVDQYGREAGFALIKQAVDGAFVRDIESSAAALMPVPHDALQVEYARDRVRCDLSSLREIVDVEQRARALGVMRSMAAEQASYASELQAQEAQISELLQQQLDGAGQVALKAQDTNTAAVVLNQPTHSAAQVDQTSAQEPASLLVQPSVVAEVAPSAASIDPVVRAQAPVTNIVVDATQAVTREEALQLAQAQAQSPQADAQTVPAQSAVARDLNNELNLPRVASQRALDSERARDALGLPREGVSTQTQASSSDDRSAVRAMRNSMEQQGQAVDLGFAGSSDRPSPPPALSAVMEQLKEQYLYDGQSQFFFRNARAADNALKLAFEVKTPLLGKESMGTDSHDPDVVRSMVSLAHAKGWTEMRIKGTPEFCREMWIEASLRGIQVHGYVPEPVDRALLQERRTLRAADAKAAGQDKAQKPATNAPVQTGLQSAPSPAQDALSPAAQAQSAQTAPNAAPNATSTAGETNNGTHSLAAAARTQRGIDTDIANILRAHGATDDAAIEHTLKRLAKRMPSPRAFVGELLEHGAAPFKFDPKEKPSYFVKLKTEHGEKTIWGVDLPRAIEESETAHGGQVTGKNVLLAFQGEEDVEVTVVDRNAQGVAIGDHEEVVKRNTWYVKPLASAYRESLQEVLEQKARDQAVQSVPEKGPVAEVVSSGKPEVKGLAQQASGVQAPQGAPAPEDTPTASPLAQELWGAGARGKTVDGRVMAALGSAKDRVLRALSEMGVDAPSAQVTVNSMGDLLDSQRFHVGELLAHGKAPYLFQQGQEQNYFVRIQSEKGPLLMWGQELERAIAEGGAVVGQPAVIAYRGLESFEAADGTQQRRLAWLAAPLKELHEDAQVGVVQSGQGPAHGDPQAAPLVLPVMADVRKQQSVEVLARAMGIANYPPEIVQAVLSDIALSLQNGTGPAKGLRLVQTVPATADAQPQPQPRVSAAPQVKP